MKNLHRHYKNFRFFQSVKITILFLSLMISIASCIKDDDIDKDQNAVYMISFKANGVLKEFSSDHSLQFGITQSGDQHIAIISGFKPPSSSGMPPSTVGIQAIDIKPIASNTTYSGYTPRSSTPSTGAYMHYNEDLITYNTLYLADRDMTLQIIEITSTMARGTFKGTLKSAGNPDLKITDGKFHVPIGEIIKS